jgi:hypothetical protein
MVGPKNHFFNYFLSFLNPNKLEFHCSFEVLHLEKLEKFIFQIEKKMFYLEQLFFSFFHTKRQENFHSIFDKNLAFEIPQPKLYLCIPLCKFYHSSNSTENKRNLIFMSYES